MKLTAIALFGAGYVLGTRAGRERYEQLAALGARLADRLDERVAATDPDRSRPRLGSEALNGLDPGRARARSG